MAFVSFVVKISVVECSIDMVKIKVCGITSLIDAEKALEFGADLLGFNLSAKPALCYAASGGGGARWIAANGYQRRAVCQRVSFEGA